MIRKHSFASLNKEILTLAIPNVLSNISLPLMSSIDTALMGRLSSAHVAAVGLGSILFSFMYWNCGFLRMGTTGLTAQYYGADDSSEISSTLWRSMLLAVLISVTLMILSPLIFPMLYNWLGVEKDLEGFLTEYLKIRFWEIPSVIITVALLGWYFGMQNALYPMIITISINVLNMGLSYYLVVTKGMSIKGVAIGTLVANYTGLVVAVILFFTKYKGFSRIIPLDDLLESSQLKKFLDVNRDIAMRTILLTLSILFFFRQSSIYGTVVLAVNTVLWQFVNWVSYGIDGFAFAAESIVGKYRGASDLFTLKKAIRYSFFWGLGLAVIYAGIYFSFGHDLLHLFTDENDILQLAKTKLYWIIVFPLISFMSYIWDGVFVGLTASRSMFLTMVSAFVFYILIYFAVRSYMSSDAIWLAFSGLLLMRGIGQQLLFSWKGLNLR